jgi:hypothetical protein
LGRPITASAPRASIPPTFSLFNLRGLFRALLMLRRSADAALAECKATPQAWAAGSRNVAAAAIMRKRMTVPPLFETKTG